MDLGRPVKIVGLNITLASDVAAVVPNLEVRLGNSSGPRENPLCKWFGRTVLVRRRRRNFVLGGEDGECGGVARFVSLSSVGATTAGSASLAVCDLKVLTPAEEKDSDGSEAVLSRDLCQLESGDSFSRKDKNLSTLLDTCVYQNMGVRTT